MYCNTNLRSSNDALDFMLFARWLITVTFPFTYPLSLFTLSIVGEFGIIVPSPINNRIPKTGQTSGTVISSIVMLNSLLYLFALLLAYFIRYRAGFSLLIVLSDILALSLNDGILSG